MSSSTEVAEFTMSNGLERDALVILRMDGEDLLEFVKGPSYEHDMISIFSQIDMASGSFSDCTAKILQLLSVDHGMPPLSDSWVMTNIVEPVLQSFANHCEASPITEEMMLEEFKKVAETLAQLLKDQPVIVAHYEQTFDGTGIRRLLSSKFELNKALEVAMKDIHRDDDGKVSKDHLQAVLGVVGPAAGLPPFGTIHQMDTLVKDAIGSNITIADDRKMILKDDLKKLVTSILENMMVRLQETPVVVSSNTVLHEPLSSTSPAETSSS